MNEYFILNTDGNPVAVPSLERWVQWLDKSKRSVAVDHVGDVRVSTVFLGLDHGFGAYPQPILWETMVFGGKLDQEQARCSGTREQAEAMHAAMVQRVRNSV